MKHGLFITTGGTGGHIYPSIVLYTYIRKKGIPSRLIIGGKPHIPVDIENAIYIPSAPFIGRSAIEIIKGFGIIFAGLIKSTLLLLRYPYAVFSSGGYPSLPILISSFIINRQYFLYEQNTIPGRLTRFFSFRAKRIFTGFEETTKFFKKNAIYTGNPIRPMKRIPKDSARRKLGIPRNKEKVLLIFGGSQGSSFLNKLAIEIAKKHYYFVLLITGLKNQKEIENQTQGIENINIFGFLKEIDLALSAADIVLARAGALTITELAFFGIPSLLIPFPYAADNHQTHNAKSAGRWKNFKFIPQKDASLKMVLKKLSELQKNETQPIIQMAQEKIYRNLKCFLK